MRTVSIAVALVSALSACSLYFEDGSTHKQQPIPGAGTDPDGGWGGGDAGIDDAGCCDQPDGGGGCGDGGLPTDAAPGDAGWPIDADWPADAGAPADAP